AKVAFHTSFSDVQGLKTGAPIRLGGVDIGTVSRVQHRDDPNDNRLYVDLNVAKREAVRIRKGTVARIASKGLLGDKMIELVGGPTTEPPIPADGIIEGEDPSDFSNLFAQAGTIAKRAENVLGNLESATKSLADAQMQADLRGSAHSIHVILQQVAEG